MRVSLGLAILSVVLLPMGQAQVARAETFPLYGMGSEPLRSGRLAADVDIVSQPIALAIRPDGVVAFGVEGRVYWVLGGRLVRVAVPLRGASVEDLAFTPDGALLVASCPEGPQEPASVFRAAPGAKATVVAGIPGRRGTSGDGGPATAAKLRCAQSIAVEADGSILIADAVANRVRRVDPQGVIHTVAGTGRPTISGDGGAAAVASLGSPTSVAALPGGGFAIAATQRAGFERAKPAIRVVDNNAGAISTRARRYATEIAAEPDGSLLLADTFEENAPVRRLSPNGRLSVAADVIRDRVGIPEFPKVDGDPFGSDDVTTNAAVPTPDGGLLVAADFGISYVAPQRPQTLAVAMLAGTRRVARELNVPVRLTREARLTLEARRAGRVRARVSLDAHAGDTVLPLGRVPPGLYNVRVVAEGGAQVATAHAFVLAGGRLPVGYARDFIGGRLDLFERFVGGAPRLGRCGRRGSLRVDCALRRRRRCAGVVSLRLRANGSLVVRQHRGDRHCR